MIIVKSRDGYPREIDPEAAKFSGIINEMLEVLGPNGSDEVIPLNGIEEHVLNEIILWLDYCKIDSMPNKTNDAEMQLNEWREIFFQQNNELLIELLEGASYLHVQNLMDITSQLIANMISGESLEAIRTKFNISDDLTQEQKDIIRRENDLCGVPRP